MALANYSLYPLSSLYILYFKTANANANANAFLYTLYTLNYKLLTQSTPMPTPKLSLLSLLSKIANAKANANAILSTIIRRLAGNGNIVRMVLNHTGRGYLNKLGTSERLYIRSTAISHTGSQSAL